MSCLPDRLIVLSSSSPASTPSRVNPPSRASAGGSSIERGLDAVADVAQIVELGDERLDERRAQGRPAARARAE